MSLCRFTLPLILCFILASGVVAGASQQHHPFPLSGVILWSTTDSSQVTQLHASTVIVGKVKSEKLICRFSHQINSNGGTLFSLAPNRQVVLAHLPSEVQSSFGGISVIDLVSGETHQLTQTQDYDRYASFSWSPTGRYVAALRQGTQISILDTTTRVLLVTVQLAYTPIWARDGQCVIFSRFASDSQQRQYWTVPITGGAQTQISDSKLDQRVGPAYRQAIHVYEHRAASGVASPYLRDDPGAIQLSPDGMRAVVIGDVALPEVRHIQAMGMIEFSNSLLRTRFSLVDAHGIRKQRIVKGGYGLFGWSQDGRYVYGGGRDADGKQVLIALNSRTLSIVRFPLAKVWEEREIEGFRELPLLHERRMEKAARSLFLVRRRLCCCPPTPPAAAR